jgi:hypothetical protein
VALTRTAAQIKAALPSELDRHRRGIADLPLLAGQLGKHHVNVVLDLYLHAASRSIARMASITSSFVGRPGCLAITANIASCAAFHGRHERTRRAQQVTQLR